MSADQRCGSLGRLVTTVVIFDQTHDKILEAIVFFRRNLPFAAPIAQGMQQDSVTINTVSPGAIITNDMIEMGLAQGMGETRRPDERNGSEWFRYFGDYGSAMTSFLMGKTLVGMRAADILRGVDLLHARDDVDAERIYGIGKQKGLVLP